MIRLLGSRGASAVLASFILALSPSQAQAQSVAGLDVKAAVKAIETDGTARPLGTRTYATIPLTETAQPKPATTAAASTPAPKAVPTVTALYATRPAASVTVALPPTAGTAVLANGTVVAATPAASPSQAAPAIAREAAWLYRSGWPLYALVDRYGVGAPLDEQANCIAVAIYHEARGESLDGQLAVARVIMNRAASGKYPVSWCAVVKQPWQFSFVNPRTGHYPSVNYSSASWRKAVAITRLAISNAVPSLSSDVLWYHADYVAPSWGRRLNRVQKIGTHIFYRS